MTKDFDIYAAVLFCYIQTLMDRITDDVYTQFMYYFPYIVT